MGHKFLEAWPEAEHESHSFHAREKKTKYFFQQPRSYIPVNIKTRMNNAGRNPLFFLS